jgi:protein-L-isoaspartate O-methyltransferase
VAPLPSTQSQQFAQFRAKVLDHDFACEVAVRSSLAADVLHDRMATAVGEAEQTLRLLDGLMVSGGDRVIEIGAGLGLTSAFLASCGYDVVAWNLPEWASMIMLR